MHCKMILLSVDALGQETIHVICEVKDDGTPQLTRYRRIIITVEQ